jgi:hypothetical protein
MCHVSDRIDMDHGRHDRHDENHDSGQRVEPQRPVDIDPAGTDPGGKRYDLGLFRGQDAGEQQNAERHRQQHRAAGDELRSAEADHPPEKPGDHGGQQRQENDGESHRNQPLIM